MYVVVIVVIVAIGFVLVSGGSDRPKPRPVKPTAKPGPGPHKPVSTRAPTPVPQSRELSGKCYVIDGDTIIIKRTRIRLAGIDAPELDQPYGQKSKWAIVSICKGQVITARLNGETSYDRVVGTCHLPDGRDIGAELVRQGLACDWHCFSGGKYQSLEPVGARLKLRRPPYNW